MLARAPGSAVTRVARRLTRDARMSTVVTRAARKPGVATDDEFDAFLATHDRSRIVVVDARNPDFTVEPDDETYGGDAGSAPISDCGTAKRPNAVNAPFDRAAKSLPLDAVRAKTGGDATTPIVTSSRRRCHDDARACDTWKRRLSNVNCLFLFPHCIAWRLDDASPDRRARAPDRRR